MNTHPPLKFVTVAVGILRRPDGNILLASRPADKPWPGYWEFPGGKIEPGETAAQALARELAEELGIQITEARPWLRLRHEYPTTRVQLHCFIIEHWQGDPRPMEGQTLCWQHPDHVDVTPLLPANGSLLRALLLPPIMGITHAEGDAAAFLPKVRHALAHGLKLIQIRERGLPNLDSFALDVIALAHDYGARVVVNGDMALATRIAADGIHLNADQLGRLDTRPDFALVGASCHNDAELTHAEQLRCDYALLSPVLPTASHPGATTLGWDRFQQLAAERNLPVYALGGMTHDLLDMAHRHDAHGIALLRGAWQ